MASLKVNRALQRLGSDIQIARKKRRIAVKDFATRLGVAEGTVIRLEKGEPGVRMETLAMALMVLGELHRLKNLLDPSQDDTGLILDQERLPKRIASSRRRSAPPAGSPEAPVDDDEGTTF